MSMLGAIGRHLLCLFAQGSITAVELPKNRHKRKWCDSRLCATCGVKTHETIDDCRMPVIASIKSPTPLHWFHFQQRH